MLCSRECHYKYNFRGSEERVKVESEGVHAMRTAFAAVLYLPPSPFFFLSFSFLFPCGAGGGRERKVRVFRHKILLYGDASRIFF
jgi:hypothetical protein